MKTGKLIIVGILGLALAAATAGWMHQYYETDYVQSLWGSEALALIAYAPQVKMISRHEDGGVKAAEETEASRVPGMSNIRYMLGRDFSYETATPEPTVEGQPSWGLEFRSDTNGARLDFSEDCRYVTLNGGKSAMLVEPAAAELLSFFKPSALADHQTK
jgi:hypothetical protein